MSKATFEIDEAVQNKKTCVVDAADGIQHQQQRRVSDSWIIPLCVSHAAAAWGERSWEFGAGLLLLQLNGSTKEDSSLRLTAMLVLAECTACSLLGPRIGRAVDRTSFLLSAILTLALQSIGITFAAGFLLWAFDTNDNLLLAVCAIASSVLARLASVGSTIAVEKKWAMALSHHTQHCYDRLDSSEQVDEQEATQADESRNGQDSQVLSTVNARLRCIDLTCNLCAPIAVGFLLENTSPAGAAMSIAAFNAFAWPIEAACLFWIHYSYNDVFTSKERPTSQVEGTEGCEDIPSLCEAWTLYYKQTIFRSALALAVLYLSVVSFGTIMTAWFTASGFHAGHLGAARALAALSGMLSTATTPSLFRQLGVERTGLRYIWFMFAFILPCTVAGFLASSNPNFLWIIVVCVIVSRFGLWGFDLCVTQLLQERIEPPDKIGEVNGTQVALQNVFDALAALSCVLLPNPNTFVFLILGSFGSVTVAALLHTSSALSKSSLGAEQGTCI